MKLAKIITEISPKATLRAFPVGEEQVIPAKIIAASAIRKAASTLKSEGYEFHVSSKRDVVDTYVTRLK